MMKFALADTDEQFKQQLDNLLVPLLVKLATPQPDVVQKVVSVLSHVNKV